MGILRPSPHRENEAATVATGIHISVTRAPRLDGDGQLGSLLAVAGPGHGEGGSLQHERHATPQVEYILGQEG